MAGPLDGVRVLELTRVGPGAFCTMMLADMGADVLKIEPPPTGALRGSGASPGPDEARTLATSFTNRNKRSLTLNLKSPDGQEILHGLVREHDVLVEGFRPGVMDRLGGGYERLSELNPRLVYCALSGFGQDGPYRDRPAHDLNFLALGGVLDLIGEPDGDPAIPLNIIADYAGASMHGFAGVLLALYARERTGRGQLVDVSYLDTTISLLAATPVVRDWFADGEIPGRGKGVFAGRHAYYGTYRTRDGKQITVGCTEPWLWNNFCDAVGRPHLKECGMKMGDFSRPANEAHAAAREELEAPLPHPRPRGVVRAAGRGGRLRGAGVLHPRGVRRPAGPAPADGPRPRPPGGGDGHPGRDRDQALRDAGGSAKLRPPHRPAHRRCPRRPRLLRNGHRPPPRAAHRVARAASASTRPFPGRRIPRRRRR